MPVHLGGNESLDLLLLDFPDAPCWAEPELVIVRLGFTDLFASRLKRRETLAQLWTDILGAEILRLNTQSTSGRSGEKLPVTFRVGGL